MLDAYIREFCSLISSKISDKGEDVKKVLRLNSADDFDFLIASRNIIEDASLAIAHFERFGLAGATKYEELGEKYLRLYGLLSAVYMQQEAILRILKIMNVPDPKSYRDRFDELETRSLRHKLVAHGTSYEDTSKNRSRWLAGRDSFPG